MQSPSKTNYSEKLLLSLHVGLQVFGNFLLGKKYFILKNFLVDLHLAQFIMHSMEPVDVINLSDNFQCAGVPFRWF
jgi:hypothetical protein